MIYADCYEIDPTTFKGDLHWNLPLPRPEEIEARMGLYDDFIETFLKENKGLWGFKNPKTNLTLKHWQRKLVNPKYIIVTRNPLNIAKSWKSLGVNVGMTKGEGKKPLWNVIYENNYLYNYVIECLQHEDPKNYMFVAYEKLLNEPESEIRQLAKFVGVRLTPTLLKEATKILVNNKKF